MREQKTALALACLGCGLVAMMARPCEAATRKTYDASLGTLPDAQGFTLIDTGGSPPCTIQGDAMHQGLTAWDGQQLWTSLDVPLDFDVGGVVEADVKIIYSSCSTSSGYRIAGWHMGVSDASRRGFFFFIASDEIFLWNEPELHPQCRAFDPTDGFHHYRLVITEGVGSLFIDEVPDPFLSLPVGPPWSSAGNRALFGDSTFYGQNESLLRSFSYGVVPNPIRYITAETLDSSFVPTGGSFGRGQMNIEDTCPIFVEAELGTTTYEGGTFAMDVSLFEDDSSGGLASGIFREGDLYLADAEGEVVLTGEVTEVVLQEVETSRSSLLTGVGGFVVTGGLLADDFTGAGEIVQITFDLAPGDIDDFTLAFTGVSNITLMPIPEPAALSLLGLGGLALLRRRKR